MNNQSEISPNSHTYAQYMQLLIGQQVSLLGSFIAQFVIIWWITFTYQSAFYLAMASFLGFGSTLLTSLFSGVYIDRYNRKKLILYSDSLQALLSLIMIYLFFSGSDTIVSILFLLALRGVLQGIQQPSLWAIVPMLVPKDRLTKVNSIEYLFSGVISMIGPLLAALLLSIWGLDNIGWMLFIDVITYLISFLPLVKAFIPTIIFESKSSYWTDFREGVDFIKRTRGLITLMMIFPFANFFLLPIVALLPLIVIEPELFKGNQNTLAFALAVQQVAFIIGSALMSSRQWFARHTIGIITGLCFWITGTLIIILGATTQTIILLYLGMFISGFTIPITNVSSQTIWQTVVPDELQGRVTVVRRFFGEGSAPLSFLIAGLMAESVGAVSVIFVGCLLEILVLVYILFFTQFTEIEKIISQYAIPDSSIAA